jgi:PAS domain S-box-containing protein
MATSHVSLDSALGDALLRATSNAVLIVDDTSWRVVAANDAAAKVCDLPQDRLVGVAVEALFALDGVSALERTVWRAQMDAVPPELPLERPDGRPCIVRVRAQRCEFSGCTVCLLALEDITRERALAEQVAEARREQQALLDAIGVGLLVLDAGGRVLLHNQFPALEEAFGPGLSGRNFFLDVAHAGEVRPVLQRFHEWAQGLEREPYVDRFEFEVGRRLFEAELRAGSHVGGGVAVVRVADATERRRAEERLRKQTFHAEETARHAALVYQTASLIHRSLDLDEVLATAVGETGRLLGASRCQVLEIRGDGRMRVAHEYVRPDLPPVGHFESRLDDSPAVAHVARALQPLAIEEVEGHPLGDAAGLLAASGARSTVIAPITLRREPRGALAIHQADRTRAWTGGEIDLVVSVANQVGLAIEHTEIHERVRRQAEREAIASRLAASLHAAANLNEVLERTAETLTGALGVLRCVVLYPATADGRERTARSWRREAGGQVVEEQEAPAGLVALASSALGSRQAKGAGLPVVAGEGERLAIADLDGSGALVLERGARGWEWNDDDLALVGAVAKHVGVAIGAASLLQAVVAAKRMWEGTFDAMSDGIVIHDEKLRIVRVNRAFARLARSGPARLVGSSLLDLLEPANRAAVESACERVAVTRRPVTFDIEEPDLGGTVSISVSRLQTVDGVYFIHTLRDITHERQMQERLAQSSKMASIGHLATGVAHEINTPLATITGCAQSLARQLAALPDLSGSPRWEAISERLATIVEQSFRCKKITRDLLDYAKPTKPTMMEVDLERVAREAIETIEREREGVQIPVRVVGDPAPVTSDPDLLRQVVINLLVNALDATEAAGGGTVAIEVRYLKRGVRLGVRDTGKGMEPGEVERVFDPFYTTKPPGRGTGLGLSISHSIVVSLGGRIDVTSRPGRGSRFTVWLPQAGRRGRPQ